MRRLALIVGLFCLGASLAMAQGIELAGKVLTTEDQPLPGVTITVRGTTISTVSGEGGAFRLSAGNLSEATVIYSFVGFTTQEKTYTASDTNITIKLEESPLDYSEEMVITGFATSIKRRNLANSVASVSSDDVSRVPVQSVDDVLNGKFAGVQVRSNGGAPGGGMSVKLRGLSTINGTSQPLYVVDGVIISNAAIQSGTDAVTNATGGGGRAPQDNPSNRIADLVPSEIESIEVLKGPSAAAIYGSKASNGVVIITTKRGQAGKTQYDVTMGFGQRSIIRKLGQRVYTPETVINTFGEDVYNNFFAPIADANGNYEIQDFEEQLYGNDGAIQELNFSARGGTDRTSFFVSGSSLDDEGIIKETGYAKNGLRLNIDHRFSNAFRLAVSSSFVKSVSDRGLVNNENNNGTTFGVALTQTPNFFDLRPDADGNYPVNPFAASNPLQTRDLMTNRESVLRTINSMKLDWEVFATETQTLDFNITAGIDFYSQESEGYFPAEIQFEGDRPNPGTTILGETESENSNVYFNLAHNLIAGSNSFTTSAGVQYEEQDLNRVLVVANGLPPGVTNIDRAAVISDTDQNRILQRDSGFFIQEEVQLGDAVYFGAGIRGDSSSANGDSDKVFTYPKASASVRLSDYDFWDSSWWNELKLRAAYGKTGNLPPPVAKYDSLDSENIDGNVGLIPANIKGNPDIEPETSTELEIGFDAGMWDDKATLSVSYYKQDIADLILQQNLAPSSGYDTTFINGGEMETDGLEIALGLVPVRSESFDWTARLNYAATDSVITQLDVPAFNLDNGGFAPFLGQHRIEEGRSATQIIGIENGELVQVGDETPDFQLSWDNYLRYKNWSLTWLLDWKEGGDVINLTTLLSDLNGTTPDLDTPEGQARAGALGTTTSQLVEDGSYIKLREVRIQYELAKGQLNRWFHDRLSYVRFSISGRNVWTDTDYTSYDPEVSNFSNAPIGSVEVAPFPTSKSWFFQIAAGL